MAKTPLKQQFLHLLRDVMRRNGVRQADVARHLNMSASAMSQVMSGVMLPSQRRLDQMFEFLHPDLEEAEELQHMLYWLRSGRDSLTSGSNRRLFMLRCRSGMSIRQLSESTGMTGARLRKLENAAGACPTSEEATKLAGALGCSTDELIGEEKSYEASAALPVEAAEGLRCSLPMISLADMTAYSAEDDIGEFAQRLVREYVAGDAVAGASAVVGVSASELFSDLPGDFFLTLGDRNAEKNAALRLCRNASGEFFVRGARSGVFRKPGGGTDEVWSVPILEICYIPQNRGGDELR